MQEGFTKTVDAMGRVYLPITLRRLLGLDAGTPVEYFLEGDKIIIRKYSPAKCTICGDEIDEENVASLYGKKICIKCLYQCKRLADAYTRAGASLCGA